MFDQYRSGVNLYMYVGSNPIAYVDSHGLYLGFDPGPGPLFTPAEKMKDLCIRDSFFISECATTPPGIHPDQAGKDLFVIKMLGLVMTISDVLTHSPTFPSTGDAAYVLYSNAFKEGCGCNVWCKVHKWKCEESFWTHRKISKYDGAEWSKAEKGDIDDIFLSCGRRALNDGYSELNKIWFIMGYAYHVPTLDELVDMEVIDDPWELW